MIDPMNRNESTEENANEITQNASHSPESNDNGWCCTCGARNKASEQNCHACGRSKELLVATLNADVLDVDLAEQLEKRSTEEQERLEREEQEQEILNAEHKKRKSVSK